MSSWGSTAIVDGVLPQRRVHESPVGSGHFVTDTFHRPELLHFVYKARHSTDDLNNVRQGETSLEHVWQTKDWSVRVFVIRVCC